MEWSMNLFPADMEAARFRHGEGTAAGVFYRAMSAAGLGGDDEPGGYGSRRRARAGSLLMVWPLEKPQFESGAGPCSESGSGLGSQSASPTATQPQPRCETSPCGSGGTSRSGSPEATAGPAHSGERASGREKNHCFPVADDRQRFADHVSKSCEALLDLYVNNARYCRGEAVKIGENFGLKINEVGTTEERGSKILN